MKRNSGASFAQGSSPEASKDRASRGEDMSTSWDKNQKYFQLYLWISPVIPAYTLYPEHPEGQRFEINSL